MDQMIVESSPATDETGALSGPDVLKRQKGN